MVGVGVNVEQPCAGRGERIADGRDAAGVASLRDVGNRQQDVAGDAQVG